MLRLVLKVLFVVKVLLLVQLTLLNTDADVSGYDFLIPVCHDQR